MNRIKELRTSMGLTQEDVCAVLNVQRSALSKYETGAIPLTDSAVTKLADYFNVTTDYLLGRADKPAPDAKKPTTPEGEQSELTERDLLLKELAEKASKKEASVIQAVIALLDQGTNQSQQ